MAHPSQLTDNYDALLTTTLRNYQRTLQDNISTSNVFFYSVKKYGAWETLESIGERMQMPLMYEIGEADSYSGYDLLNVTPMEGLTSAFYEWRQASVPISISGIEKKKNSGEARILDLLKIKNQQAEMGITEFVNKRLLIGAGGSSITTAYSSPANGSSFLDPLPLHVAYDPTASVAVGNINQYTYSWWRNKTANSTATTFAAFLTELRKLRLQTKHGPGGGPNLHLVDDNVYALYEQALAAKHQNPSYERADIPYENIAFYKQPVVSDEFVPDVQGGSETQSTTSGTWFMLNTKFWGLKVHAGTNFAYTDMVTPENQDAATAHILFLGATGCGNRRKQGVIGGIDTTLTS